MSLGRPELCVGAVAVDHGLLLLVKTMMVRVLLKMLGTLQHSMVLDLNGGKHLFRRYKKYLMKFIV